MRAIAIIFACLAFNAGALSRAEPLDQWLEPAFANMGPATSDGWSFKRTTKTKSPAKIEVETFDPTSPGDGWTLDSVNGKAPSRWARAKYAKTAREPNNGQNTGNLRNIIKEASLEFLSEDDEQIILTFKAQATDPKDPFTDHLVGEISINKSGPYVEQYRLYAPRSFSTSSGIRAAKFDTIMSFAPVGPGGPVFLSKTHTILKGDYARTMRVNTVSTVHFSDYRKP